MNPSPTRLAAAIAAVVVFVAPTLALAKAAARAPATDETAEEPAHHERSRTDRTVLRPGKGGKGGRALSGKKHGAHASVGSAAAPADDEAAEDEKPAAEAEEAKEDAKDEDKDDEKADAKDGDEDEDEEEEEPELLMFAGEVRFVSNYIWRGYVLSPGYPAVQPWMSLELGQTPLAGLALAGWASTSLWGGAPADEWNLFLSYHHEVVEKVEVLGGGNLYVEQCTTVQPCTDDPQPPNQISGELFLGLAADLDPIFLSLTYSRGFGVAAGNSLAFFGQFVIPTGAEWLNFEAYLQADYSDEFLDDAALAGDWTNRFASFETGLVTHLKFGHVGVLFVISNFIVPSPFVQSSNAESGGPTGMFVPFAAAALAWEAE